MAQEQIVHVPVKDVKILGWNKRESFELDELIESIKKQGVLQPVILRANGKGYDLVAGERRLKACQEIDKKYKIPAVVKDLTDEQVLEIMTVENIQRENLTPLEEARQIAQLIEVSGFEKAAEIAADIGKSAHWVRKRAMVTTLPDKVLSLWTEGELGFGHLEQCLRVAENEKMLSYVVGLAQNGYDIDEISTWITNNSTSLKTAKFDTTECVACKDNSEKQYALFGLGDESARCQNQKCFKKKLQEYLQNKWDNDARWRKKFETNTFIIGEVIDIAGHLDKIPKECKECNHFATGFNLNGTAGVKAGCLNAECLSTKIDAKRKTKTKAKTKVTAEGKVVKDGPRVSWHGKLYREKFYQDILPDRINAVDAADPAVLHTTAFALVKAHKLGDRLRDLLDQRGIEMQGDNKDQRYFNGIKQLVPHDTLELIKMLTLDVVMTWDDAPYREGFNTTMRDVVAEHFGIRLEDDFRLTPGYLQAKSRKEILEIIESMGKEKSSEIKHWLMKGNPKASLDTQKKSNLINLIFKSGVDLKGVVPAEIANYDVEAFVPSKNRKAIMDGETDDKEPETNVEAEDNTCEEECTEAA